MGTIFNFGNETEKMQPGEKISFGKLDFIADQLENLHLQELETPEQEEERSPPFCAFVAGLEESVDAGPLALARHLTRHAYVLAEAGRDHELNVSDLMKHYLFCLFNIFALL